MGFIAKDKSNSSSNSEGWGMGFFLVFFAENEPHIDINTKNTTVSNSNPISSFKSSIISPLRRTTSNPLLLSRAQSTISVCAFLIFLTLLVFTLSTFEPTTANASASRFTTTRRHLSSSNAQFISKPNDHNPPHSESASSYALQGMGILYRRGTKSMNDLIVAHVTESVTEKELRLFLRLLYKSSLSAKSDLVLIFPSSSQSSAFVSVIFEENESFFKLLNRTRFVKSTSFDAQEFVKSSNKEKEWGEPIWGRRIRSNHSEGNESESTRLSYGSVVSFVVDELDPEKSLAAFLDHVPMSMRRWACYPMLLGRVRRNFKHIILVDVKEVLLLGDPLSRIRNRSPESVLLSSEAIPHTKQHGKKNSVKTQSHKPLNSAVIIGGARGVRRLSNAMLTEIVRVTTQQKRKNSVTETVLFNQLVSNEFILRNVNVITSTEFIPDTSSLTGLISNSGSTQSLSNYTMVRRGNSNKDSTSIIMKHVCALELNSSVYSDCL